MSYKLDKIYEDNNIVNDQKENLSPQVSKNIKYRGLSPPCPDFFILLFFVIVSIIFGNKVDLPKKTRENVNIITNKRIVPTDRLHSFYLNGSRMNVPVISTIRFDILHDVRLFRGLLVRRVDAIRPIAFVCI